MDDLLLVVLLAALFVVVSAMIDPRKLDDHVKKSAEEMNHGNEQALRRIANLFASDASHSQDPEKVKPRTVYQFRDERRKIDIKDNSKVERREKRKLPEEFKYQFKGESMTSPTPRESKRSDFDDFVYFY